MFTTFWAPYQDLHSVLCKQGIFSPQSFNIITIYFYLYFLTKPYLINYHVHTYCLPTLRLYKKYYNLISLKCHIKNIYTYLVRNKCMITIMLLIIAIQKMEKKSKTYPVLARYCRFEWILGLQTNSLYRFCKKYSTNPNRFVRRTKPVANRRTIITHHKAV